MKTRKKIFYGIAFGIIFLMNIVFTSSESVLTDSEIYCMNLLKGLYKSFYNMDINANYKKCWKDTKSPYNEEILDLIDSSVVQLKIPTITSTTGNFRHIIEHNYKKNLAQLFHSLNLLVTKAINCTYLKDYKPSLIKLSKKLDQIPMNIKVVLKGNNKVETAKLVSDSASSSIEKIRINCQKKCAVKGKDRVCNYNHCDNYYKQFLTIFDQYQKENYYLIGYYSGDLIQDFKFNSFSITSFSSLSYAICTLVIGFFIIY